MPGRSLDQAVQYWREVADEARQGRLQHDRVTRADSLTAMLCGGKDRGLLQPRQDRSP
jgi:hypothetical protein